jgi:hypothetical protein
MMSSRTWLIAALVLLVACMPVLNFVSGSATPDGHAGASHHGHEHGQGVAQAAQLGLAAEANHVVAAHPHIGALHQLVYPGIDGVFGAIRSMNPLRVLAVVAVIAMALTMFIFAGLKRSRAPPKSGGWLGPARPGRAVIADLCVIRR